MQRLAWDNDFHGDADQLATLLQEFIGNDLETYVADIDGFDVASLLLSEVREYPSMLADAANLYSASFAKGLSPPENFTVSQWADKNRKLSTSESPEPGRWRTSRVPYLREIMDCLSVNSPVREVTFMKASQVAGTECGLNWMGYVMDNAPGPCMAVFPVEKLGQEWSKNRLNLMIESTPKLAATVGELLEGGTKNSIMMKLFPGGFVKITGGNSPTTLRSTPVKYLYEDELDAFPLSAGDEGDPIMLAEKRTANFSSSKKILRTSSPALTGSSRIEHFYQQGDQRRYHVPCPHCQHKQVLEFKQLKWKENDYQHTAYECINCEKLIAEHHKTWMLENGQWVAMANHIDPTKRSYHISALYSPLGWFSWEEIAYQFSQTKNDKNRLKVFINTVLGETWQETYDQPQWERLKERAEKYDRGLVQQDVLVVTGGVDVQADRLEMELVGWDDAYRSWSLDYQVLEGSPQLPQVWMQLRDIMTRQMPHANGGMMPISSVGIDSNYLTDYVLRFVKQLNLRNAMLVRGVSTAHKGGLVSSQPIELTHSGKGRTKGVKVWNLGVDQLKIELYGNFQRGLDSEGNKPPGYCHFPQYEAEYFQQIVSEIYKPTYVNGRLVHKWHQTRPRNEALDCRVYALAALKGLGYDQTTAAQWDRIRQQYANPLNDQLGALGAAANRLPAPAVLALQKESNAGFEIRGRSEWLS